MNFQLLHFGFKPISLFKSFLALAVILTSFQHPLNAQECSVSDLCLDYEEPQFYTTITASDPGDFVNLIATGKLLHPSQSESTPQRLIVCREITVNGPWSWYVFAPGSEIIFATPSSGMVIASMYNLQLRGTHIHGCSVLWNGIEVKPNARLDLVNLTKIEDAVRAVKLNPFSSFSSSLATFEGNYISVYGGAPGVPPASVAFSGIAIHGTTFSGAKTLLQPHTDGGQTFTRPNIGILLENVAGFNVGVAGGTGVALFKDFANTNDVPVRGIRAINSNATILHSRFENIGSADGTSFGFGISGYSDNAGQKITLTGLGGTEGSITTFSNVYRCVSLESMRLSMTACHANQVYEAVYVGKRLTAPQGVFQVSITNNFFQYICNFGLEMDNTTPSKSAYIADNQFLFNNANSLCAGDRFGIRILKANPGNGNNYVLLRNIIRNTESPGSAGFRGIRIENISNVKIDQCRILDEGVSGDALRFTGVLLNNAPGTIISNTNMVGNTTNYPLGESAGVLNKESNSTVMTCNFTSMIDRGFNFVGMNCDATNFSINSIGNHQEGLYLADGTIMGDQFEKLNNWSAGAMEGKFDFPGYDPQNFNHVSFVELSKFNINTFNENSSRWANPRNVGADPDADHNWFEGSSEVPFNALCAIVYPGPSIKDQRVINGTIGTIRGLDNTQWESKYHTYGRLDSRPDLRPTGSPAYTWYQSNNTQDFAQLSRIERDFRAYGAYSVAMENAFLTLDNDLQLRDSKESEWAVAGDFEAQNLLLPQLRLKNIAVITRQNALQVQYENDGAYVLNSPQILLNSLNGMTFSSPYAQDIKSAFQVMLEMESSGLEMNNNQYNTLSAIAAKCRLEGGYGVVIARALLNLPLDAANDTGCGQLNRSEISGTQEGLQVFPNPSQGTFSLNLPKAIENTEIIMTDLTGKVAGRWMTNEATLTVQDTYGIPGGVYLITVKAPENQPLTVKLILVK